MRVSYHSETVPVKSGAAEEAQKMLGRTLVTKQTGNDGKEVRRIYIEEGCQIAKEFYLAVLIDRSTSRIAFVASKEGGMDIEEVASKSPDKIITTKVDIKDNLTDEEIFKIFKKIFHYHN